MSYWVEKRETFSDGVRRIATEEIHRLRARLEPASLDSTNIHEARRHLKKVRALLRFAKKQFSEASFKRENYTFRDAGKILSPIRDAHVISNALATLKNAEEKSTPGFRLFAAELRKDCDRQVINKAELTKMTKALGAALDRVENWPLANFGEREAQCALGRSFRRCKKAFHKSTESEKDEALHDWRKRVKDLEFHLCLFRPAWRKKTKRVWKEIKCLDDFLGKDHDLVMLSEKLDGLKSRDSQKDYQEIIGMAGQRRTKLRRRAQKIATRLFKQRPKDFVVRMIRF